MLKCAYWALLLLACMALPRRASSLQLSWHKQIYIIEFRLLFSPPNRVGGQAESKRHENTNLSHCIRAMAIAEDDIWMVQQFWKHYNERSGLSFHATSSRWTHHVLLMIVTPIHSIQLHINPSYRGDTISDAHSELRILITRTIVPNGNE